MKPAFIILLLTLETLSVTQHKQLNYDDDDGSLLHESEGNSVFKEQLKVVLQSKMGNAILKMAELNIKLQGPVDELIETIKTFSEQLQDRIDQENADFSAINAEHQSKFNQIQVIVNSAEMEVSKEKKRLYAEMLPRKEELERILSNYKDSKVENSNQVKIQNALRKQQAESFTKSVSDYGDCINAVDETIKLLENLLHSGGVSLVQAISLPVDQKRDLTKRLKSIKGRLESSFSQQFSKFIQSLAGITEKQDFSQRHQIKQATDLLNNLRKNLVDQMNKLIDDENQLKLLHEERLQQLSNELDVFDSKYADLYSEREDIGGQISDTESIIQVHNQDLESYKKRLEQENANYATCKKIHDELIQTITEEMDIIEKAIKVVRNPSIHDYLQNKMGKWVI